MEKVSKGSQTETCTREDMSMANLQAMGNIIGSMGVILKEIL